MEPVVGEKLQAQAPVDKPELPAPSPGGNGTTTTNNNSNRSSLVDLAVKFLNNPRVVDRSREEKRAFLKKKGLSEDEINTAISKVGPRVGHNSPTPSFAPAAGGSSPPLPPRDIIALSPYHPPQRRRSWSEYVVMATVVGGVGYAVIHFVKHYFIPWMRAPKVQEEKLDDINASVKQLQVTVSESLADSTRALQALLAEQQQHIQLLTTQVTGALTHLNTAGQPYQQLKEEINSLKGILLSRHQFPPTPTRGGVANGSGIPAWQRTLPISSEMTTPTKNEQHGDEVVNEYDSHSMGDGQNEAILTLKNENGTVDGNENGTINENGHGTVDGNENGTINENGTPHVNENLQDKLVT